MDIDALSDWIVVRFIRSPGPGGQNVNKVSTTAVLEFDFEACPHITESQRTRLRGEFATRMTRHGMLRISARKHRTQSRNRAEAERHLLEIIELSARVRPVRRRTRPTGASRRRRIESKRDRGQIKNLRRKPNDE
jgi:ribosome-associated protein